MKKNTNCCYWRVRETKRERSGWKKSSYSIQSKHQRCFMPFHSQIWYIMYCCARILTHNNFRSKSFGMHVFERARQRIFIILIETWCKCFQAPPCVYMNLSVHFFSSFKQHFTMVLHFMATFYTLQAHTTHMCAWILSHFISTDVANPKYTTSGRVKAISQFILFLFSHDEKATKYTQKCEIESQYFLFYSISWLI